MKIHSFYQQARFKLSTPKASSCPTDSGFEVAFAGCSNAGKSSAINAITQQKKLAKVSKTPGRTRHLVFFELDKNRRLVDLPGYGYTRVPSALKKKWHQEIGAYFAERSSLSGLMLMMDIRHPLKKFDEKMLYFCSKHQVPVHILLTKADKLNTHKTACAKKEVVKKLSAYNFMSVQTFSAVNRHNIDLAWEKLDIFLCRI